MNRVEFAKKLEESLSIEGTHVFANSDDSLSVYSRLNDKSVFFTIPCHFDEQVDNVKRIKEISEAIKEFINKIDTKIDNLSVDVACSVL